MIKVISIILAAILVAAIIGSLGFIGVKTGLYMVNQHFGIGEALDWAWTDYTDFVTGFFEKAEAESKDYYEYEYNINSYIDVVACTALQL